MTTEYQIYRGNSRGEEEEITATIEWQYFPASRGARDSLGGKAGAGPPLEPDEPASLEFLGAVDPDGKELELTERELQEAEEKAWEALGDD